MSIQYAKAQQKLTVESVNETIQRLHSSRATVYELLNTGEIESYVEGRSRKVITQSVDAYIARRLEAERARRAKRGV